MDHGISPRQRRRRWWWAGAAAAPMLVPAVADPAGAAPFAVMAALALAAAVAARPHRRISPARAAGAVAVLSLVTDVCAFGKPGLMLLWYPFETVALLVLLERVVRRVPGPRMVPVAAVTGTAAVLLPLRFTLHAPTTGPEDSVVAAALALFPVTVAAGIGLYLRTLDHRRAHAVELARREQRLEVARDLHDFVAHEITGIVLEAQAAQFTAGPADEEHHALLARVEAAGVRALDSMDRTVTALRGAGHRPSELPPTRVHGLADLPGLVDRFAAMSPADVTLALPDEAPDALAPETGDTAYRVVLEALTNVRRHAPGAGRIAIAVARTAGPAVTVSVVNHASPAAPATARRGGGTGLAGLDARVTALGGTLTAGPYGPGWRVHCLLPAAIDG
ncbi:sensor histidine kinase [Streptomyces sp. NPDC014733]|uniref:sensor histidine kinase n=1 Tax=Streptomyces sp. NPDC014733 TaxID=3364885 RepID=UPI0036FDA730